LYCTQVVYLESEDGHWSTDKRMFYVLFTTMSPFWAHCICADLGINCCYNNISCSISTYKKYKIYENTKYIYKKTQVIRANVRMLQEKNPRNCHILLRTNVRFVFLSRKCNALSFLYCMLEEILLFTIGSNPTIKCIYQLLYIYIYFNLDILFLLFCCLFFVI
jgi:hypothetical protein